MFGEKQHMTGKTCHQGFPESLSHLFPMGCQLELFTKEMENHSKCLGQGL